MYILTNEQMRGADAYTIKQLGVPSLELMERAGIALADLAEDMAKGGRIVCVCGGGNNGGDGFVCARHLLERGRLVDVVFYAEKCSVDCKANQEKWQKVGGKIFTELPQREYAVVVDCLFGTGFHGEVKGKDAHTIQKMNALSALGGKTLAADIPSGVNGENGVVGGVAVHATKTLCIGEIKAGALLHDGMDYAGEIERVDIGIQLPKTERYALLLDKESVSALLPVRKRNSHKGTFGRAAIVAGSRAYTGAAYLATMACLRAGAGYTFLCAPQAILSQFVWKIPEAILSPICAGEEYVFDEEKMSQLLSFDSVAYGMGMGATQEVCKGAKWLLEHFEGRLILDADGLNSLAYYAKDGLFSIFKEKKCDVILTPHCKEYARLSGQSIEEIVLGGLSAPIVFAKQNNLTLLLKGSASLVSDGERVSVNATGNSGLAKGGSGDLLSGLIAGLCAMGLSAFDGGRAGSYLLGRAAEIASLQTSEYSLTATDVLACIGKVFLELKG